MAKLTMVALCLSVALAVCLGHDGDSSEEDMVKRLRCPGGSCMPQLLEKRYTPCKTKCGHMASCRGGRCVPKMQLLKKRDDSSDSEEDMDKRVRCPGGSCMPQLLDERAYTPCKTKCGHMATCKNGRCVPKGL